MWGLPRYWTVPAPETFTFNSSVAHMEAMPAPEICALANVAFNARASISPAPRF